MKNAGLCVRYDCDNFGSMLQILATQRLISECGWTYQIIKYDKRTIMFYIQNVTRIFNPYFMIGKITNLRKRLKLKQHADLFQKNELRRRRISEYRTKYIGPYSETYRGYKTLQQASRKYDAIIVGSDQLWTPAGIKSKFYNLLFVSDDTKKVSFATSFGVSRIPASQRALTRRYLERIDFLSVREQQGAEIVRELTGREALVALDPTLLLSAEEWQEVFPRESVVTEPYILAYFLGSNPGHRDAVNTLREKTGLSVVTIPFMDEYVEGDRTFGDQQLFDVGPVEFLNLVRGAEYVCTDSFHGSVFSILHHKRFLTFDRKSRDDKNNRNSRIESLFSMLGLENRRYSDGNILKVLEEIDYQAVDDRLSVERLRSKSFLEEALS